MTDDWTAAKMIDLTGHIYGWLTVKSFSGVNSKGRALWNCLCQCGMEKILVGSELRRGTTISCGCFRRARVTTHGKSRAPIYAIWNTMMRRCYLKSNSSYLRYGDRGIKVCDRWHKFENFYKDMGERPFGLSLERLNNDGDYSPQNCKWATIFEQARNTRKTRLITIDGRELCLSEWRRLLGVSSSSFYHRLARVPNRSYERAIRHFMVTANG